MNKRGQEEGGCLLVFVVILIAGAIWAVSHKQGVDDGNKQFRCPKCNETREVIIQTPPPTNEWRAKACANEAEVTEFLKKYSQLGFGCSSVRVSSWGQSPHYTIFYWCPDYLMPKLEGGT
jgi:hypothetical protein